jgi:hypothetical protein
MRLFAVRALQQSTIVRRSLAGRAVRPFTIVRRSLANRSSFARLSSSLSSADLSPARAVRDVNRHWCFFNTVSWFKLNIMPPLFHRRLTGSTWPILQRFSTFEIALRKKDLYDRCVDHGIRIRIRIRIRILGREINENVGMEVLVIIVEYERLFGNRTSTRESFIARTN